MIAANEMMLGNFLQWKGSDVENNYFNVTSIEPDFDWLEEAEPIPLTEEWLLRLGFKKDHNEDYLIDLKNHYLMLILSGELWYPNLAQIPDSQYDEEQIIGLNSITSVHQLQNLIYIISGEHLTIKQ